MTEVRASYATTDLPRVAWHISPRSPNGGGSCVEAGPLSDSSGRVALRHSHHPHDQALVYGRDEWATFIDTIKTTFEPHRLSRSVQPMSG